jgi:hypothetical protein
MRIGAAFRFLIRTAGITTVALSASTPKRRTLSVAESKPLLVVKVKNIL